MSEDRVVVSINGPILSKEEEEEKRLLESLEAVGKASAYMHAAMEQQPDNLVLVLRYACTLLEELRTDLLAPQNYYEVYVKVFDELQDLVPYFVGLHRRGVCELDDLYEHVQHTGRIVTRLYLLTMAGAAYMEAGEEPVLALAKDLLEMSKGLQHPTRGLFFRSFLLSMLKGKLPGDMNRPSTAILTEKDVGTARAKLSPSPVMPARDDDDDREAHGAGEKTGADGLLTLEALQVRVDGGGVLDSAMLLLQNFREMNWLWIRMEGKGFGEEAQQRSAANARRTYKSRKELRVLVGLNVVRIAQLEGIDVDMYAAEVLPPLLSVVVRYREPLAQQYLMEIIVQVFPDEFHMATITALLSAMGKLSVYVDVCTVLQSLVDRLTVYVLECRQEAAERKRAAALQDDAAESETKRDEVGEGESRAARLTTEPGALFDIFIESIEAMPVSYDTAVLAADRAIKKTSTTPPSTLMPLADYVSAMRSLAELTIRLDPPSLVRGNLSSILQSVADKVAAAPNARNLPTRAVEAIEKLLTFTMGQLGSRVDALLEVDSLVALASQMPYVQRRRIALAVCDAVVTEAARDGHRTNCGTVTTLDGAGQLFVLLDPLLSDQADAPSDVRQIYQYNPKNEFREEQEAVCRVLNALWHKDPSVQLKMFNGARKMMGQGGPERVPLTFPTLASLYLQLALRLRDASARAEEDGEMGAGKLKSPSKALQYLFVGDGKGILEVLAASDPLGAFLLYLEAANVADACALDDMTYELYTAAFTVYEEGGVDSQEQVDMLMCAIQSLYQLQAMSEENYEVIATRVCQYSAKLLRKADQARMVAECAHLFAKKRLSAEQHERVLECLKRALKLASQVLALHQLALYVDLLNLFLHFYAKSGETVSVAYINGLLDTIRDVSEAQRTVDANAPSEGAEEAEKDEEGRHPGAMAAFQGGAVPSYEESRGYYRHTAKYIRSRQSVDPRWEEIEV